MPGVPITNLPPADHATPAGRPPPFGLARLVLLGTGSALLLAAAAGAVSIGTLNDAWMVGLLIVVPAALATACFVALAGTPATRTNAAIVACCTGAGLVAGDALLLMMDRPRPREGRSERIALAASRGSAFDVRTRREVAESLRLAGHDAYLTLPAAALRGEPYRDISAPLRVSTSAGRVFPLAQRSRSTMVHCNESGHYSVFVTDRYGFNNPDQTWDDTVRVAGVGDSFVNGSCVPPDATVMARVRERMPRAAGLATDGFGPLSQLALIREYLVTVRPAHVLWFYFEGNDLSNLAMELADSGLRHYRVPGFRQNLSSHQSYIDSSLAAFTELVLAADVPHTGGAAVAPPDRPLLAKLTAVLKLTNLRQLLGLTRLSERRRHCCDVKAFGSILADAERTVGEWGGQLHFVYLPSAQRFHLPPLRRAAADELRSRRRVLRQVARLGIPVIDMQAAFAAHPDPRTLFVDWGSHYNQDGYIEAARAVVRHLESRSESTISRAGPPFATLELSRQPSVSQY